MKISSIFIMIIALPSILACTTIIEEDIENDSVKLLSPPNDYISKDGTLTFWWEQIDGAENYELQVVSKSFDYVETLIVDTLLSTNKYSKQIDAGEYSWRVRAINDGYKTNYTSQTFRVEK